MTERTIDDIKDQIREAARNSRWLPSPRPSKGTGFWPDYIRDYPPDATYYRKDLSAKEISDFDQVIEWLARLKGKTARIIWFVAVRNVDTLRRHSWAEVARYAGASPRTCRYWYNHGIRAIHKRMLDVNKKK